MSFSLTTRWQYCSTFRESRIGPFSKAHGAIRQPQLLLRQQEHLSVEAKLSCYWVTHLEQETSVTISMKILSHPAQGYLFQ